MTGQIEIVLAFWFGAPGSATEIAGRQNKLWFGKSPENDQRVIEHFSATLTAAAAGQLDHWTRTPRGRLALVIVLDQFPHHIHRDQPQAFATDSQSLALSLSALESGEDRQLTSIERVFLYLPLEHAESIDMQTGPCRFTKNWRTKLRPTNARCSTTFWITRASTATSSRASAAFRIATPSLGALPRLTKSNS